MTSISVKAADGTAQTYGITSATKIRAKGDSKTRPGTIGQVKTGDQTIVGTGTTTVVATQIRDRRIANANATTH